MGLLWIISRVMYGVGYYHAPASRVPGAILGEAMPTPSAASVGTASVAEPWLAGVIG